MNALAHAVGREYAAACGDILVKCTVYSDKFKLLWGFTREMTAIKKDEASKKIIEHQSMIRCSDLKGIDKPGIPIRDGIKIDGRTGIVEENAKYTFQVVERGAQFKFNLEADYSAETEPFVKQAMSTIYKTLLSKGGICLGAKTNSGFGEVHLLQESAACYKFDFSQKPDVAHWMTRNNWENHRIEPEALGDALDIHPNRFSINASFWLKNSLIVRSYSADPDAPDATHITSNTEWILPGTSLKGAIRARAERIVNTIFDTSQQAKAEEIIRELFGYVDENRDKDNKKKAKIRVKETILPKFVSNMQMLVSEMQTRIKIDRFTGGTIESALFETMPVFSSGKKPENAEPKDLINLQIHVQNCQKHEAGLLLLVLKDLWTGDLAVGGEKNVGRGVFQGIQAIITSNAEEIRFTEDLGKLTTQQKETLQGYVNALNSYLQPPQEEAHA
jgi:CRISPR/Cas system CSM-associated protein Csm3 (group 7 of RAMP superfamily)